MPVLEKSRPFRRARMNKPDKSLNRVELNPIQG
jgi:hypothetical protein